MADLSEKPALVGRVLRAIPCVCAHSLCLFALFVLFWLGGGEWSRAADEVLMERSPTTDALLALISAIVHHPTATLVLLLLVLLIDFALLVYLDRPGVWRLRREIWTGTLWLAIVAAAFLAAYSLSNDATGHWNQFDRGQDIQRRQVLKRLDQLAGAWKLVGEQRDGQPTAETELKDGQLVIERREGLCFYHGVAENEPHRPAVAVSLTLAGEERHGKVAINIWRGIPENIDVRYDDYYLGDDYDAWQEGIYRFADNRLELSLSPAGRINWQDDFSTKENANVRYLFERVETPSDGTP